MEAIEGLVTGLEKRRAEELRRSKGEGRKVVGYVPNGYLPEELVYAAGSLPLPVGLLRGGEHEAIAASALYLPRFLDTFCRAQIGYRALEEDFLYRIVDSVIVAVTDNNVRAIADSWAFYTGVDTFQYGVPHVKDDLGLEYYLRGLGDLQHKLQGLTGIEIDSDVLRDYIELFNEMRDLLKRISLLRTSKAPPVSGKEFVRLNHASFYAEPHLFVQLLRTVVEQLEQAQATERRPRIMLVGSTLAQGDYKLVDLVERTGAAIVIEDFSEGIRPYWDQVHVDGDLLRALAEGYFMRNPTPAFFRPAEDRNDSLIEMGQTFRVDGVIWYQLMYRDAYDVESYYFEKLARDKLGIPMLKVQSDYDRAELAPLTTRIETFVETIARG